MEDNLTNLNQKFDQQTLTSEQFTTRLKNHGRGVGYAQKQSRPSHNSG
ncbi:hypothetical protein QWZ16_24485 [Vibrio ostreicida]|uniref:Uncharacterized protein n=1 Tax=Vibrio ostreicida TaxID=526588 RepID=A0ABT8C293_9VIBR|nr:hypothetical protein [Vibrio ostreicida]MDN3612726.1 hypothetical protein [Vibrio ostreicida]